MKTKSQIATVDDATDADAEGMSTSNDELSLIMERGTVAKGRTVVAPTSERRVVGHNADGPVYRFVEKHHLPGQEVTLPAAEIAHLRRQGFLVDPNAAAIAEGNGPTFQR